MRTNFKQFNNPNPALPRRTDDASMKESGQTRGGPQPAGRNLAGKVMGSMSTPVSSAPMGGLGATTRPPGLPLNTAADCRVGWLGMDGRRTTGNGMEQGKPWRV
jgi:hypothetical protein